MKRTSKKQKILIICTHNSARSQMAEGYLNHTKGNKYQVYSAGTEPTVVNPLAIEVMREIGINISNHKSKHVNQFLNEEIEYIVTVCDTAKEICPFFPYGKKILHQSFPDPSQTTGTDEEILSAFRKVRDSIIVWIDSNF
ncbi:arsenate reductase ArsC [Candidatus Hodarchaeum mangrovi]